MKLANTLYAYTGVAAAGASLFLTGTALAESGPIDQAPGGLQPAGSLNLSTSNPDLKTPIASLGNTIINVVFLLALIIAILYLVYSGILYITSAGAPEKAKIARGGVINSIIGIVIIAAAYGIIHFALGIGAGFNSATNSY